MFHKPRRERPGIGAAVHKKLRQIQRLRLVELVVVVLEFVNKLRIIEFVVLELRI